MKESEAVLLVLDTIEASISDVPDPIPLRTAGQIDEIEVPAIVLEEWDTDRLRYRNGARNYAARVVDNETGDEVGIEYHIFYDFTADIVVRHTNERNRDDLLAEIRHAFIEYEDEPKSLHADISEITVGDATPRALVFREPDWYQGGLELSFVFVEKLTTDGDSLSSVQQSVEIENLGVDDDDDDATWIGRNL